MSPEAWKCRPDWVATVDWSRLVAEEKAHSSQRRGLLERVGFSFGLGTSSSLKKYKEEFIIGRERY